MEQQKHPFKRPDSGQPIDKAYQGTLPEQQHAVDFEGVPPLCEGAPPVNHEMTDEYINEVFDNIADLLEKSRYVTARETFRLFVALIVNTQGYMMAQGVAERLEKINNKAVQFKNTSPYMLGALGAMQKEYADIAKVNLDNINVLEGK